MLAHEVAPTATTSRSAQTRRFTGLLAGDAGAVARAFEGDLARRRATFGVLDEAVERPWSSHKRRLLPLPDVAHGVALLDSLGCATADLGLGRWMNRALNRSAAPSWRRWPYRDRCIYRVGGEPPPQSGDAA